MPEYLEIFNAANISLKQVKTRRQVHEDGDWHRTAQVYIVNSEEQLLCNLRSAAKDVFPLLWDLSIGGHLSPGENYEMCALRELEEELGIEADKSFLQFITVQSIDGKDEMHSLIDREHAAVFLYHSALPAQNYRYQQSEIVQLKYFSICAIKENLQSENPAIPIIPLRAKFLEILSLIGQHL